jgi:hypothetical protein
MTIKTITGSRGKTRATEIRIAIKGKGGTKGQEMIKRLVDYIEYLKVIQTPQHINEHYCLIMGYCRACEDMGYIDKEGADELIQLAAVLAGVETERAQKKLGKAGEGCCNHKGRRY